VSTRASILTAVLAALLVSPARAEEPKKEAEPKPHAYKVPKGWETDERKKSGFVTARFRTGEGDKEVTVILIALAGNGGGLVANVNRWRAQVGLKDLAEKDALTALEPIKVDGRDGHVRDVTGPEVADKVTQRVVAVVVPHGDATWFIKMSGPTGAVGDQKKAFDEFVKSLRFEK
jgi:hypothetical protein